MSHIPEDDQVELLKQYLKGEAKLTVKLMLGETEYDPENIFEELLNTYGDRTPVGTLLREFYETTQRPGLRYCRVSMVIVWV